MSAELAIRDLEKVFPTGKPAVDGVSFTITPGEIVVLLGPSGCGKTTTLRCVAGLEHPTAGEISLDGELVSAPAKGILTPPRARNIGMVKAWPSSDKLQSRNSLAALGLAAVLGMPVA